MITFRTITRLATKITVIMLAVSLNLAAGSDAVFSDQEASASNLLTTTTLDVGLASTQSVNSQMLIAGAAATGSAHIQNLGQLPFNYDLAYQFATGSSQLCQALQFKVWYNWYDTGGVLHQTLKHNGPLADFTIYAGSDTDLSIPNAHDYYVNSDYAHNEHWYSYEAGLPTDAPPSLNNQTCNFQLVAHAWQTNLSNWGTGFWDQEVLSDSITTGTWETPPVCTTIQGYKYQDADTPISGWDIVVHNASPAAVIESFSVPSNNALGISSSTTLANGNLYLIEVSGTWLDNTIEKDAASDKPLLVNGTTAPWGSSASNHMYKLLLPGDDQPLTLNVFDDNYTDNTGSLTVSIADVTSEVVTTNAQGYYSKEVCGEGDYHILEVSKPGWNQISPSSPNYYHVTLPGQVESHYNFINHHQDQAPIVINEVYYDVDSTHGAEDSSHNDEWIELYNTTDQPINLKDWVIEDNSAADSISHSNRFIPAHGFAVLAKAAQTWDYWSIPGSALKIPIGHQIGGGLDNDGDHLILKDNNGDTIDQISWGNNTTVLNPAVPTVSEGHSIARNPLGQDTNAATDFADLTTPNPGTNPHSHIQAHVVQNGQSLIIGFEQAFGFDRVKYAVAYHHQTDGQTIAEVIEGEADKPADNVSFALHPIYMGTCSSLGEVCVPHTGISEITVSLLYQNQGNILGTSTLPFTWNEVQP